jgi:Nuclear transport factor 2 (NTF2) domain
MRVCTTVESMHVWINVIKAKQTCQRSIVHCVLTSFVSMLARSLACWFSLYIQHSHKTHTQQPSSMMTFEGQQVQGPDAILAKLQGVGQVRHTVKSTDVQPSLSLQNNAILIFVTGTIQIGGDNPLHYCELFQLVSQQPGQYYVHNCIFRLNCTYRYRYCLSFLLRTHTHTYTVARGICVAGLSLSLSLSLVSDKPTDGL